MDAVKAEETKSRRLLEKLNRLLGEEILGALSDDDVTEIIVNADGSLWTESSAGMKETGHFLPAPQIESVIKSVATAAGELANHFSPLVEAELSSFSARFEGVLPPLSTGPLFVIRKPAKTVYPLSSYLKSGILTEAQFHSLKLAVAERKNILVAGATGSGKTTLVNALIKEAVEVGSPGERFVLLEDTYELQCSAKNSVHLHTTEKINLLRLTQISMRLRPERIIVGEVRGAEAHALIKVLNTGHPGGISTIHAETASGAIRRLELLIEEAGVKASRELIEETIGLIVVIGRDGNGKRKVNEISFAKGFSRDLESSLLK